MPKRLLQPEHRLALIVSCVCAVLIFVSMGLAGGALFFGAQSQGEVNHSVCVALNNNNQLITETARRSRKNIPRLAYFRSHPAELQAQLAEIDRTIKDFKPRTC